MNHCLDDIIKRKKKIMFRGWVAPDQIGEPIVFEVLKNGKPLDCTIRYMYRDDVLMEVFGQKTKDRYGFFVICDQPSVRGVTLRAYVPGKPEEELQLDIGAIWKLRHSLRTRYHQFRASENKKDFFKTLIYPEIPEVDFQYDRWARSKMAKKRELALQKKTVFPYSPTISVLVPVYKPEAEQFTAMIESVLSQTYPNFELCLADGCENDPETEKLILKYAEKDPRIKPILLHKNGGISVNTNAALERAEGEWISLLDQDDLYAPNALYEFVKLMNEHPEAEMIYSDEDQIDDASNCHKNPHFKPDADLARLHCDNYVCHLLMVKREIALKAGGFDPKTDGAQDFDFTLRCTEKLKGKMFHIPKLLYYWRIHEGSTAADISEKPYAIDAGKVAAQAAFDRNGVNAEAVDIPGLPGRYGMKPRFHDGPLVSIIIPNKDHIGELSVCLSSIFEKATYQNYEIVIVENNSTEPETFDYYEKMKAAHRNLTVTVYEGPFNFSAINNAGVRAAKGDYYLFLNNDTKVITEDFIESMLVYCQIEKVGIVGAKLLYADDTVQHAGILVGVDGKIQALFSGIPAHKHGYVARNVSSACCSAVTGACLMIRKDVFEKCNGWDENFPVAYNDVDLCLQAQKQGYDVVFDAFAQLYHYESKSRGLDISGEEKARLEREFERIRDKWPERMKRDPYYNDNLDLKVGYYEIPRKK